MFIDNDMSNLVERLFDWLVMHHTMSNGCRKAVRDAESSYSSLDL